MSQQPDWQLEDGEYVDRKVKERILNSRQQVDSMEQTLFDEEVLMPDVQVSYIQKVVAWGNSVRRFLRNIEPILDLKTEDHGSYYLDEITFGTIHLVPPDQDGYPFSLVSDDTLTDSERRQLIGVGPDVTLPEVQDESINGLRDVVNTDPVLSASWTVRLSGRTPAEREVLQLEAREPVAKSVYEDAVRAADRFLFDMGIGAHVEPRPHKSTEPGL